MTTTASMPLQGELAAVAHDELERWSVPGIAIGVLCGGAVQALALGAASLETGFPVRTDTLFQVGSISKIATTTVVMQLVDEDRLDLDAPVVSYLPSLQLGRLGDADVTGMVTMRHLLTHTSGFFGDRFWDYGVGDDALARAVAEFSTLRQYTRPGAFWAYNNLGFQLAGRVAEYLLDKPFEVAVRERVFAPLGMAHTTYFAHEAITHPVATGHNLLPEGENEATHFWGRARCRNPQGGVLSTVGDLLRFAAAHMQNGSAGGAGGRILSPGSVTEMQRPQVEAIQAPHWGLGWWVDPIDGEPIVGHGGVTNGFQAQLTVAPACGAAFAFLSNGNQGGTAIRTIEAWLLDRCLSLRRVEPPVVRLPEATLARISGRYEGAKGRYSVAQSGGGLRLVSEVANMIAGSIAPPVENDAEPIGGLRFRFTDGVNVGLLFDFIEEASNGPESPPRYLRIDNRLVDRL